MPLFPPVIDTLRWADLVREGRSQLPLVAPEWTDQNASDPGIAMLELVAWLIETDLYRSSAVTDRERRLLLELAGFLPRPPQAAHCLVQCAATTVTSAPAGLLMTSDRDAVHMSLTLLDDVAITGSTIAAVAWVTADAGIDGYITGCCDLRRERAAGRAIMPLGSDPSPGDAFIIGLDRPTGIEAGPIDLWFACSSGPFAPEEPEPGQNHHSATIYWETWDGAVWLTLPPASADDSTAALTRSGRVRLMIPGVVSAALGDQSTGAFAGESLCWLRCRLLSGRHDAAPSLVGVFVDTGEAIAAFPYGATTADPVSVGMATGVPSETFELPGPWSDEMPTLSLSGAGLSESVRIVSDLAQAAPTEYAAQLDPDGVTVRFGDGLTGRTIPPGMTVSIAGLRAGGGNSPRPPTTLITADASIATTVVANLQTSASAEDPAQLATRAEAELWVHDALSETVRSANSTSLDDLPLDRVRTLGVPERAVTALDFERLALFTPGTTLWRARALSEVDPRLPGFRASGCVTVVLVPTLPTSRPEPTKGLIARVGANLANCRTLGTRVFVVGPDYASIGVTGTLVLLPGAVSEKVLASATVALRRFLHPVTGGASGRGWPFGRTVRRTEILQLLDSLPGVDRIDGLVITRERTDGSQCHECGDVDLSPHELVLAGTISLTPSTPGGGR